MIVDLAVYRDGQRVPGELNLDDAFEQCHDGAFVWLGLHDPTQQEIARVSGEFGIHELAAEDALHAKQRPKLEDYGDVHLLVLKPAQYNEATERVELGEILIFAGESFIIVVRHGTAVPLVDLRKNLESRPDLLKLGPGAVMHAIVDRVVDAYVPVVVGIENDVDEVEDQVFDDTRHVPVKRIYFLRREILDFYRSTNPLREPLRRLADGEVAIIHDDVRQYFRDAYDHVLRVDERVVGVRDLLTGLLDAALSRITVQQNEDMRRISAWVAVGTIPILVTGAYGMNLARLPLDDQVQGFGIVVAIMAIAAGSLAAAFRRRGWL